jgi:hypothetical protein
MKPPRPTTPAPEKPDPDPEITVCWEDENGKDQRQKMRQSEAWALIDFSQNIAFCANCDHDIDKHAASRNVWRAPAGCCHVKGCKCKTYEQGYIKSKKELEEERALKALEEIPQSSSKPAMTKLKGA